jgi:N-acetylneuraminic acid mutarotase
VMGDALFVFGGMFSANGDYRYVNHIYRMDLLNNSWAHTGRYLSQARGFAMVVPMSDTELAVLGGHAASGGGDGPTTLFETFGE